MELKEFETVIDKVLFRKPRPVSAISDYRKV